MEKTLWIAFSVYFALFKGNRGWESCIAVFDYDISGQDKVSRGYMYWPQIGSARAWMRHTL